MSPPSASINSSTSKMRSKNSNDFQHGNYFTNNFIKMDDMNNLNKHGTIYGSLIKPGCGTYFQPDKIQSVTDTVPLFPVESTVFPHGIEITRVYLKTSASSTLSVNLEEFTSPTDGAPSTITTIATSASTEADEAPDTDGTVAAGSIIMLDLDTTDVDWLTLCIDYYEPIS